MTSDKKSPRIFYGWWIVIAMIVITTYMGGVVFFGFSAFILPIQNSFPTWSRTVLSSSVGLRSIESGILAPFAGRLVDRYGPRRLIAIGATIVGLSLVMLSQINSLWMFYLSFVVLALGMSCCTLTVPMSAVANWFHKKLGIASAIAIVGFGLSTVLVKLVVKLIDVYDWRTTFLILAAGIVFILPLSLVFRHKPQPYGYLPDGAQEPDFLYAPKIEEKAPVDRMWKWRDVLKDGIFWKLTIAYICHMILVAGIITQLVPHLDSVGVADTVAANITIGIGISSIGGRLGLGWLGGRKDRRMVSAAAFIIMAFAVLFYLDASSEVFWLFIPFALLFGFGYGGNNALRSPLIVSYFGRANFGAVLGLVMGVGSLGGVIGSTLAGTVWDVMSSYRLAWSVGVVIAVIGMISIWSLPKTRTKNQF